MGFEFPNYDRAQFISDIVALEEFCSEDSDNDLEGELSESSDNDLEGELYGNSDFFSTYNRCFSFNFFQKLKTLYSSRELEIQAYRSSSDNFNNKKTKELCSLQRPNTPSSKADEVFELIWDNFGIESGVCFLFEFHLTLSSDLQKKSIFAQQIKTSLKTLQQSNFNALEMNLAMLLGSYNYLLNLFLDSLAARETLIKIYHESKDFPLFREEIFRNILSLDQKNNKIADEFLRFRAAYVDICFIIRKID